MRSKLLQLTLLAASPMWLMSVDLLAVGKPVTSEQPIPADDQQYTGTWTGTYSSEDGGTGNLTYILSKDEKGQWHGTVKYTNQDGEQTAELKSLQVAGGKLKAQIDSPDHTAEITIEGEFHGTQFEGTYSVSEKGSTEIAEKGTWKATKTSATKTER